MSKRRASAIGVMLVSSVMALFGVAGHSRFSGPVIMKLWSTHGVHRDDLVVLVCWLLMLVFCWNIWRSDR